MTTPSGPSARAIILWMAAVFLLGIAAFPIARVVQKYWARHAGGAAVPADPHALSDALARADGWVNGAPAPTPAEGAGPIVVVVWSDTDPASLRALATAEAWSQAYARWGVRVLGVHAPDFAFAADSSVAGRAARRAGATFPIALDPAGQVRLGLRAPESLPAVILADASGAIRKRAAGIESFGMIEFLLRREIESAHADQRFPASRVAELRGPQATTVVYLGAGRVKKGPLADALPGASRTFTAEFRYQIEGEALVPYPVGRWTLSAEGLAAARGGAGSLVALRYRDGSLDAVVSPPPGQHARVWVLRDEAWLKADVAGPDVRLDSQGHSYVDVDEARLYEIARGPGEHVIKLSPEAPGVTLHALIVDPTAGLAPR